jgi:NDP-sugar pyrophosphorylase family protein
MTGRRALRHAVILAAGRGTRMFPLTEDIPKPMAPFRGETLIAHGIAAMKRHGLGVHITVGYRRAALAQHVMELGVDSVLNTEGRSNAWFIYNTLIAHIDAPVVVMTCDNVTEIDFAQLVESYYAQDEPACMLVPVRPIPGVDGDYIRHHDGLVTSLSRQQPTDIYCSGIQILNPQHVRKLAPVEGDFNAVWTQLIERRALRISSVYPYQWMSIDTVDALAAAERA